MIKWRKSSRSGSSGANCIELSEQLVRDSKNPSGPHLRVEVPSLISAIKAGWGAATPRSGVPTD